jgi:hypothetical protein
MIAAAAAVAFAALPAAAQQKKTEKEIRKEDWKDFKAAADFKFACRMPGKATATDDKVPSQFGELHLYTVQMEAGGVTFNVSCVRYPDGLRLADPKAPMENMRNATIARLKGAIRTDKEITVAGLPAREVVYATFLNGKQLWTARFIQVWPRVYVVQAGRADGDNAAAAEAVGTFLESFRPEK